MPGTVSTAIVGADDSAYVFRRNEGGPDAWGEAAKITAADGSTWSFGESVSISGDTVIVGARGDDENGTASGAAYVFQRDQGGANAWDQVAKITADDGDASDSFGVSVSISGDTVVVGAYRDSDNGLYLGSGYIFQRDYGGPDSWGQVAKITASDGAEEDQFGWSVSISDETVVICSNPPFDLDLGWGSAYVFRRDHGWANTWGQVAKITASDGERGDEFGASASISDDTAVVGAPASDILGRDSGAVTVISPYEYRSSASAPRRVSPRPDP